MGGYGIFSAYYDRLMTDAGYAQRAEYLLSLFRMHTGRRPDTMLDLACGSGNLTLELAQRGIDMIGVDSSGDMLALAAEKAIGRALRVLWLEQDMRELDLYGTVECAVCTLDSLNHLLRISELVTVFRHLSLFIEPGGWLIFDVNTPYKHSKILSENAFVFEESDFFCVWRNHFIKSTCEVDMLLDFFVPSGEDSYSRLTDTVRERAYSRRTWENCLRKTGFYTSAVYEDMKTCDPSPRCERWVFVAQNRGLPRGENGGNQNG